MLSRTLPPIPVTEKDGALRFEVHAKPKAKKTAILRARAEAVEIAIAAPPVDGAANEELIRFLSKLLGVPKKSVKIVRGESSPLKLLAITGIDLGTLLGRLFPQDA
jgi:uncharacterized protein (TIGR00251 family)